MAFRTGSDQERAYSAAKETARYTRSYCVDFYVTSAANTISGNNVLALYHRLVLDNDVFDVAKAVPGIAQYARDIEDDQTYDVASEFTVMQAAITDAIAWIKANYPTDANGWLQHQKFAVDGVSVREFTPAQTAGLRTEIQKVIDSIEESLIAF